MKRLLTIALLAGIMSLGAHAQAATLQMNLTWTNSACAASIATSSTGTETAGPCTAQVYRVASTPGAACPAFSATTYSLLSGTVTQTTAAGAYSDTTVATGATYCWAVTDTFQAGGGASTAATFQGTVILVGTPPTPTGLTGSVASGD